MKFRKIGTGTNGASPKTGRVYIRLEFDPVLLRKVKDQDLSKIYLFENMVHDYAVMAIILDEEKSQASIPAGGNQQSIADNLPLPWESEESK